MKKIITFLLIATLLFVLVACKQGPPAIFVAGTYEGSGEGYNDTVKVEVTVTELEIAEIEVTQMNETESVAANAVKDTISNILETQSIEVDTVTGATCATQAIIDAVGEALESAKIEK